MVTDQVSENLKDFFEYQWGDTNGQVYIATLNKGGEFQQYMLEWPRLKDRITRHVLAQSAEGKDVYFCPSIFVPKAEAIETSKNGQTLATKANIKGAQMLWADFDDGAAPKDWAIFAKELNIPEPSMIIQSSVEGNQHVYWRTEFNPVVDSVEQLNRTIALAAGADRSGWDANQLLRPPFTQNYGYRGNGSRKPWYKGHDVTVGIKVRNDSSRFNVSNFSALSSPEREALDRLDLTSNIPGIDEVLAFGKWSKDLFEVFNFTGDEATAASPDKRSGTMQRLAYTAAESGFTDEQIYAVLLDATTRWGKYVDRSPSNRHKILLDSIARARAKIGYISTDALEFAGLLRGSNTAIQGEAPKIAYNLEDFMASDIHINWLIKDLIAERGIGIITGQPGTGKTQLGLQLAIKMALGSANVLGWNNVGGAKKVLMLSLEMWHAPLKLFLESILREYEGNLRDISKNLTISPIGKSIPFDKPDGLALINNLLSEYQPDILFIDSMQKISTKPLTDEIASKELLDVLEDLRSKYNVAIYIIHHDRKKSNDPGKSAPGGLSDMYGSQYIGANVDFVLSLRKTSIRDHLILDTWKNKLAQERDSMSLLRNRNLQYEHVKDLEDGDNDLRIISASRGEEPDPKQRGSSLDI